MEIENKLNTKETKSTLSSDVVTYLQQTRGMTLKQIGALMGLSEGYISYVRKGVRSFTVARLRMLETSLGEPLPLIFLKALDENSIPKKLKSQYKALQQVLSRSIKLRKSLATLSH